MVPRELLDKIWTAQRKTRWGQLNGIMVICVVIGISATLTEKSLPIEKRFYYGALGGLWVGALTSLTLLVPSIYRGFIRVKEQRGEPTRLHRFLLGLYFFPFLAAVFLGSVIVLVENLPR